MKYKVIMTLAVIASLLLGLIVGMTAFPKEKIVTEQVKVDVIKEVPVEVIKEVSVEVEKDWRALALEELKKEVADKKDLQKCGGDRYDEDQIKVNDIEEEYSVAFEEDKTSVVFGVELKYLDGDVQDKCYKDLDVEVAFEDEEEPVVKIL